MSSLLPNGKQRFVDNNGRPLIGGRVYYYIPNTSTPKDTWQDEAQTILNTNPIVLDARGECTAWGEGRYRQVVRDSSGNLIWDKVTADPSLGLQDELAASSGSSLVGFIQDGEGAVARTVQAKCRERHSLADYGMTAVMSRYVPDQYPTLQAAIEAFHPLNLKPNEYVDIVIRSGHQLTEGIHLKQGDYSGFQISAEDATVTLAPGFKYVNNSYHAVMWIESARAPTWNCLVDGDTQIGRGLMYMKEAVGVVTPGSGVINCNWFADVDSGAGIYVDSGSGVAAQGSVFTGCTRGAWITRASYADLESAVFDNSRFVGVYASRACAVSMEFASAKGCGIGVYAVRSVVMANNTDVSDAIDHGVPEALAGGRGYVATEGAILSAASGVATNCQTYACSGEGTGKLYARNVDASGAGTFSFYVQFGGHIEKTGSTGTVYQKENWQTSKGIITDQRVPSWPNVIFNSNGVAVQFGDGTQFCYATNTATFAALSRLHAVWTYPVAFTGGPNVQLTFRGGTTSISPVTLPELGVLHADAVTATGTLIDLYRVVGGTNNFGPGSTATIASYAVGRWY
ncbi:right-handed parallel beta-helix repeat-containing protein [Bordetella hinzii]|uniref:right-handed parallel beta-helix repeat-containing protein n=1 Tax=Bordetella hinzii TaxID=103855 RepID=UPI0039FC382F